MRYSYQLLKEYCGTDFSREELLDWLEILGLNPLVLPGPADDLIFEIEAPANRGDLLSLLGLLQAVSPFRNLTLKKLETTCWESIREKVPVVIEDVVDCPYYACRVIRNVRVEPSPDSLRTKMDKLGFRSTNNLVDLSNLVMAEVGQPLHVFDLDRIEAGIVVRRARSGETLTTLDGKERPLNPEMLVIADRLKPVAMAGIMGGANSEVTSATRHVLLESACFGPQRIRRSSRALGLRTEASLRFEKGLDIETVQTGLDRLTRLITDTCGGSVGPRSDAGSRIGEKREIVFNPEQVPACLGLEVPAEFTGKLFSSLGFAVKKKKQVFHVTVPGFRNDLKEEIDLVEEVAKYRNYSAIPTASPWADLIPTRTEPDYEKLERIKDLAVRLGFREVVNTSLLSEETSRLLPDGCIRLQNPLSRGAEYLRNSLIQGLLENMRFNAARQVDCLKIFELGQVYFRSKADCTEETRLALATLNAGDFFSLKGWVETFTEEVGLAGTAWKTQAYPPGRAGQALILEQAGRTLGMVFSAGFRLREFFDLTKSDIQLAEIYLGRVRSELFPIRRFRELPKFPASVRDLSLVFPEGIVWTDVVRLMTAQEIPLERVEVFDVYQGGELAPGTIGISFSLTFREPERTLAKEEVDRYIDVVLQVLETKIGARLRGNRQVP